MCENEAPLFQNTERNGYGKRWKGTQWLKNGNIVQQQIYCMITTKVKTNIFWGKNSLLSQAHFKKIQKPLMQKVRLLEIALFSDFRALCGQGGLDTILD